MRYAIIRNGTVENVALWDGQNDWTSPEGTELVALNDEPVGPGWTYDGTKFTAPPFEELT